MRMKGVNKNNAMVDRMKELRGTPKPKINKKRK